MFAKLWNDEAGVISAEYLFLVTIIGLGAVVGFTNLRNAVNAEYTELGLAIVALSQGYTVQGISGCSATTASSGATDTAGTLSFTEQAVVTTAIAVNACP